MAKYRESVAAIDVVVAHRVGAKDVRIELAAAHQSDAFIIESVTLAQPPQLHAVTLSFETASGASLVPPA
jgi:hypothetical protein